MSEIETMPVQQTQTKNRKPATLRREVALKAYEVYSHVYSPQEAMITGGCRGGFSVGELIAFLYAHSFPKEQWRDKVNDAFEGMNL